jgi:DNA-binding XRE family transcriptional regulator
MSIEDGAIMGILARELLEKKVGFVSVAMLLRVHRTRSDLSQADLSKKIGVSKGFISDIENGVKKLSLSKIISIAEDLGEDPNYFARVWLEDKARGSEPLWNVDSGSFLCPVVLGLYRKMVCRLPLIMVVELSP